MSDEPQARVEVRADGTVVLYDPQAEGVIHAVESANRERYEAACKTYFEQNEERLQWFVDRVCNRKSQGKDLVVCFCADDPRASQMLDVLMPGHDWNQYREQGLVPFGRGIAPREPVLAMLEELYQGHVPGVLKAIPSVGCLVILAAHGLLLVRTMEAKS